MKVKMNATIKRHEKYGDLIGGKEYDLKKEDALALASKALNHLEKWATIIDGVEDENKIKETEKKGAIEYIKKTKTKLIKKEKIAEANEKDSVSTAEKLKSVRAEKAVFEKKAKKLKKEVLKESSEEQEPEDVA